MKQFMPLLLIIIMLTSCTLAPTTTPVPELPAEPPIPVLEVQVQWNRPDEGFSPIPAGEEPKYFYDKPLDAFVPSDDYGQIYLYAGGLGLLDTEETSEYYTPFGLCTADGQIITAPVYMVMSGHGSYGIGSKQVYILLQGSHDVTYSHSGSDFAYRTVEKVHIIDGQGRWIETVEEFDYPNLEYTYTHDFLVARRDGKWGGIGFDGAVVVPFEYDDRMQLSNVVAPTKLGNNEKRYWCAPNVWANSQGTDFDDTGSVTFYFPNKTVEVPYSHYRGLSSYIEVYSYAPDGYSDRRVSILDLQGNEIFHRVFDVRPDGTGGYFSIGEEENLLRHYDKNGVLISEWLIDSQELLGLAYGHHRLSFSPGYLLAVYEEKLVFMDSTTFEPVNIIEQPGGWNFDRYEVQSQQPYLRLDNGGVCIADFETMLLRSYSSNGTLLTTCYFINE